MKRYILRGLFMGISIISNAQIGINQTNSEANATLDIIKSSKTSQADGILIPQLSVQDLDKKEALYGADQNGALVFVTNITQSVTPGNKTTNINEIGFYLYDSNTSKWSPIVDKNYGNGNFTPKVANITLTAGVNNTITWDNKYNYFLLNGGGAGTETDFPKASDFINKTIYIRNNTSANLTLNNIPPELAPDPTAGNTRVNYYVLSFTSAVQIYSNGTKWYLISGVL